MPRCRDGTRESRGTPVFRGRGSTPVFRGRKLGFPPLVSGGETWRFPGVVFCFAGLRHSPGAAGDLGVLDRLMALPFVRWAGAADREVGEPVQARRTKLTVARLAAFGHFEEAEYLAFADAWRDGILVDAVLDKMLVGDRQLAVVVAAVLRQLDLDAGEDAMG